MPLTPLPMQQRTQQMTSPCCCTLPSTSKGKAHNAPSRRHLPAAALCLPPPRVRPTMHPADDISLLLHSAFHLQGWGPQQMPHATTASAANTTKLSPSTQQYTLPCATTASADNKAHSAPSRRHLPAPAFYLQG